MNCRFITMNIKCIFLLYSLHHMHKFKPINYYLIDFYLLYTSIIYSKLTDSRIFTSAPWDSNSSKHSLLFFIAAQ